MHVIDTDVAVEYLRGKPGVVGSLWSLSAVGLTAITLAELFYGVYRSQNQRKHEEALNNLVKGSYLLGVEEPACRVFGRMKNDLKGRGKSVDDFDLMIASICIANNYTLVTNNIKHFKEINGLRIETI